LNWNEARSRAPRIWQAGINIRDVPEEQHVESIKRI
jgi:hypothetical protein